MTILISSSVLFPMGVELGSLHYRHGVRQLVAEEGTPMWVHDGEDNKKPRIMRKEQLHDS
jgi:hypothetical protein